MKTKGAYHHGDLARAALREAAVVLEEQGHTALTLVALSKRLGVTHAALYRHFPDREALLSDVAEESFNLFAEALRKAQGARPRAPLKAMIVAYLRFAREHRGRYGLMFGRALTPDKTRSLEVAAKASFAVLYDALAVELPGARALEVDGTARKVWAICHGFASLGDAICVSTARMDKLTWDAARAVIESDAS